MPTSTGVLPLADTYVGKDDDVELKVPLAAVRGEPPAGSLHGMEKRTPVQLAEDLDKLPLDERQRIAAESIVSDLSEVDPAFVERARRRGRELLEERDIDLPPA